MTRDVGRVTVTSAEAAILAVVRACGDDGAMLAGATRPLLEQVDSRTARRLAKAGLLVIDAGATARLTDAGREEGGQVS